MHARFPPEPRARGWHPYLFLAPYLVVTAIFFVYPLFDAVSLSFYQTSGPRSRVYVGLANFTHLLTDRVFGRALLNTTIFATASVVLQLPLSLGLALLLKSTRSRSRGFLRLVLFSPNLVGQIFVGILFSVLFTPRYGLINRTCQALTGWGLEERWLLEPGLAMPAMIIVSLWMYVGFNMVYFLAALQSVDSGLEDAARIDGANSWQVFRHVTLPSIRHVVVFVLVMTVIGSYQLFELPQTLFPNTHGTGPDNAALTPMSYLNTVAFERGDLGLGSAAGCILAVIIFCASLLQLRLVGNQRED